jgi:hypothetical protein
VSPPYRDTLGRCESTAGLTAWKKDSPMETLDQLLELFARSILAKVNMLKDLKLGPNQEARLRKSIIEDIRTCGGLIFPDVKSPEVSKAAQQEADRISVKICEKNWYDQVAFDREEDFPLGTRLPGFVYLEDVRTGHVRGSHSEHFEDSIANRLDFEKRG